MTLLDVHEVEPDPVGQGGRLGEPVLEAVELVVGEEGIVRSDDPARGLVGDGPGIEERVVLGEEGALERVSARVGQLQTDEQVVVVSVRLDVGLSGREEEFLERGRVRPR